MTILDADTYIGLMRTGLDESGEGSGEGASHVGIDLDTLEQDVLDFIRLSYDEDYGPSDWTWSDSDPDHVDWSCVFRKERRDIENGVAFVGRGSSRLAFVLKDGRCLKVAWNRTGLMQNRQEYATIRSLDFGRYSFLPQVYAAAGSGAWMIEDCCAQMTSGIWRDLFGMSLGRMILVMDAALGAKRAKRPDESWSEFGTYIAAGMSGYPSGTDLKRTCTAFFGGLDGGKPQWRSIQEMLEWYWEDPAHARQMEIDDLAKPENWGFRIVDGETRVVVIDAGLSEEIALDRYSA